MMNQTAQKLGMTQTSYVNPNGLPADGQITSARDLAILARAIIRDLPEYEYFVHIPSIRYGRRVTQNFNRLIGRYPGADGFKTGFICASGYNLVASATRNGKRLIAVVLGASSGTGARGARGAIAGARLRQQRAVLAEARRSAPSTIWFRSTRRRRTCATRCAAASASGRPATRTTTRRHQRGSAVVGGESAVDVLHRRAAAADGEAVGAAGCGGGAVGADPGLYRPDQDRRGADRGRRGGSRQADAGQGAARKKIARRSEEARRRGAEGRSQGRKVRDEIRLPKPDEPSRRPSGMRTPSPSGCSQAGRGQARRQPSPRGKAAPSPPPRRQPTRPRQPKAAKPKAVAKPAVTKPASRPVNRVAAIASSAATASIARSRLPSAAAFTILPKTRRPGQETGSKPEGKYHGADLAQAISGRRARRYRRHPVLIAGRAVGRKLCEVRRPQGVHLHGQVDQLPRPRRDVGGARRLSAEQGPAEGRPRRADDAERAAIPGRDRRRAARRLCGGQRQPALHPARARASAQGFRRGSDHRAGEFRHHGAAGDRARPRSSM